MLSLVAESGEQISRNLGVLDFLYISQIFRYGVQLRFSPLRDEKIKYLRTILVNATDYSLPPLNCLVF